MVQQLSNENFEAEVLQAKVPCLVDFWAEWCAPCKRIAPIVDELAEEFGERVKVCKLNIEDAVETAQRYGVMAIPTFAIFQEGKVVDQFSGAYPKEVLRAKVEAHLPKTN